MERPALNKELDSRTFRSFYYLKEELVKFCRENGLPTSGGKLEITDRIAYFLDTGEVNTVPHDKRRTTIIDVIDEDTKIESNFKCTEQHRAFFKEKIGKSFSFNVTFQKWLKSNTDKTYKEAISAYYQILEEKNKGKTVIDRQFEYNTYIRDFFTDNKGKSLEEAIKCWKYKKGLQGHNSYEKSDLIGSEMSCIIRELRENESSLLTGFLYEAIYIPEGIEPPPQNIINQPELQVYISDFGKDKDDNCLVAEVDGKVVGAVWTRVMNDYGHIDDKTPSFAISLYKEYRGLGIGTMMMKEMLALLIRKGYKKVSLSVQKINYAYKMYKKVGFEIIDENEEEYIMVNYLKE